MFLFHTAKSKSASPPESPDSTEDTALWSQRTERGYQKLKPQATIPGGRLPHFSLALPKVIELDEGDKLHLDCTVEGWPRPQGKIQSSFKLNSKQTLSIYFVNMFLTKYISLSGSLVICNIKINSLNYSFSNFPLFAVTWYKSERELTYDFRHKITAFQNMHTMEVNEVISSDAGEYVARASNAMGVMESKCVVRVTKKSARRAG